MKDYTHFVHLILNKPQLGRLETDAIASVLAHMRADPSGQAFADDLECEVAVRTSNVVELRECTAGLAATGAVAPSKLLAYQWNLAVQENKFGLAREFVARARAAGVPLDKVDEMLAATSAFQRRYWTRIGLVPSSLSRCCPGVSALRAREIKRRSPVARGRLSQRRRRPGRWRKPPSRG